MTKLKRALLVIFSIMLILFFGSLLVGAVLERHPSFYSLFLPFIMIAWFITLFIPGYLIDKYLK